jgi:hypothetical protein
MRTSLTSVITTVALSLAALASGRRLEAQDLRGTVRDSASGVPIPGAVVTLLDSVGDLGGRTISDERGQFRARLLGNGARSVRVVRLGFRPRTARLPDARDGVVRMDIAMVSIPMSMQTVQVSAGPACPRRADRTLALAVLEQARAGLLATVIARSDKPARMTRLRAMRFTDGVSERTLHQQVRLDSSGTPFGSFGAARNAADFVRHGFTSDSAGLQRYYGPDAEVLLDDRFAAAYCFHLADPVPARRHQIGLGFRPPNRRDGRIDVDGTLWIDTLGRALVDIEYRYLGTDPRGAAFRPGGRISFRTMPNGVVVIDRWSIRLISGQVDGGAQVPNVSSNVPAMANRSFFGIEVLGELARATWEDGTVWAAPLGTLRLRVVRPDGSPAAGAVVRLSDSDYEATADSAGNVGILDLMPGRYTATTVDPELSRVGIAIDPPLDFVVARGWTLITRMTVQKLQDYVGERCRDDEILARLSGDGTPARVWLLGRVATPDGTPIVDAKWTLRNGATPAARRLVTDAGVDAAGMFHYCRLRLGDSVVVDVRAKGMADASLVAKMSKQPTILPVEMRPRRR